MKFFNADFYDDHHLQLKLELYDVSSESDLNLLYVSKYKHASIFQSTIKIIAIYT